MTKIVYNYKCPTCGVPAYFVNGPDFTVNGHPVRCASGHIGYTFPEQSGEPMISEDHRYRYTYDVGYLHDAFVPTLQGVPVTVYLCNDCGAVVIDANKHDEFHRRVDEGERAAWRQRPIG